MPALPAAVHVVAACVGGGWGGGREALLGDMARGAARERATYSMPACMGWVGGVASW